MSSVGRLLSLFHANYKVKYNHCDDFILCLDGALVSSEVITLSSLGSDPRKNVDWGNTVIFFGQHGKNMSGNSVVFYRPS